METGIDKEKLLRYKQLAEKHLSDPVKLRLTVASIVLIAGVGGVYTQFSKKISETQAMITEQKLRNQYIMDIEKLRNMSQLYKERIDTLKNTNDWVEYLISGLSQYNVKLRDMESKKAMKLGAYKAISLSMEIEGTYSELKDYIEWLDNSEYLLRINSVRFEKNPDNLLMNVALLGVIQK